MKKIFSNLQLSFLSIAVILFASCQHEKLADVLGKQNLTGVGMSLPARIDIVKGSQYTDNGGTVTVPVTLSFSSASNTAFTVNLSTNVDTVATLVAAGTLPAGTIAFSTANAAAVVPKITVPAGVTSVSFDITVNKAALELDYGKVLAAVVQVSQPSKGNEIAPGKGALILTVKTTDLLDPGTFHQINFGTPTDVYNITDNPTSFSQGSDVITVKIPIVLQGGAGTRFTVDVVSSPDSVTKHLNDSKLQGSVLYPNSNISLTSPTITFVAGNNTAYLTFTTKISLLLPIQPGVGVPSNKFPTLAFTVKNPSQYRIADSLSTVYVVINPNYFRPYTNQTPFLVKGTIGAVSDEFYAAYYDFGGEGIAYHIKDSGKNGDAAWRSPDFVAVIADYNPRTVVGYNDSDEWLTYSINVEQTGNYQMTTMLGGNSTGRTYSYYVDGVLMNPTPLPVVFSNGYNNQKPNYSQVTLTKGYHILRMYWNNSDFDFQGVIFTRLN